jgi:hypothetical protein
LRLSNHLIFNGGGHHTQLTTQQQQIITPKLSLSSTLFPFPFHSSAATAVLQQEQIRSADQYRKIFTEVNEMCIINQKSPPSSSSDIPRRSSRDSCVCVCDVAEIK